MLALACAAIAASVPRLNPVWVGHVAGYRLEKWSRETKGDMLETLYLKDPRGRIVTAIHDFRVSPLGGEPIKTIDLNHDGVKEIVLVGWSGGAHGSNKYYVRSLGKHPRCLLAYDKNNVSNEHDFDFVDLDGDGVLEIRSWYDGYAYTVGGSAWKDVPVVLKLEHGRFVDRTTRFRSILWRSMKSQWMELRRCDRSVNPASWSGSSANAINLLALGEMLGNRRQVWSRLGRTLPKRNFLWLRHREPQILAIIRGRKGRYSYPKAYDAKPVEFSSLPAKLFDVFDTSEGGAGLQI